MAAGIENWKYKGVCLSGYYADAFDNVYAYRIIDYLEKCGVDSIQIVVTWYQEDAFSTKISRHPRYSVRDKDLEKIIRYIHGKGLKVILNPHVDPLPESQAWRARIVPTDVSGWFGSYKKFIEHYLIMAIRNQVDLFTLGTELVSMTQACYWTYWNDLLEFVRTYRRGAYKGKLSYLADRTEIFGLKRFALSDGSRVDIKVLDAKFWGLFDYISMSAFYEVGDFLQPTSSLPSLMKVWTNVWLEKLQYWRNNLQLDTKVIIGEIGYRSVNFVHRAPWHYHLVTPDASPEIFNPMAQANCYEAMFQVFKEIDWIVGLCIWEEVINSPPYFFHKENTHFSFINKEAAQVVSKYYRASDTIDEIPPIPIRPQDLQRALFHRVGYSILRRLGNFLGR